LSNGRINNQRVEIVPRLNSALTGLVYMSTFISVYSLLQYTPYFIVNRVHIGTTKSLG